MGGGASAVLPTSGIQKLLFYRCYAFPIVVYNSIYPWDIVSVSFISLSDWCDRLWLHDPVLCLCQSLPLFQQQPLPTPKHLNPRWRCLVGVEVVEMTWPHLQPPAVWAQATDSSLHCSEDYCAASITFDQGSPSIALKRKWEYSNCIKLSITCKSGVHILT